MLASVVGRQLVAAVPARLRRMATAAACCADPASFCEARPGTVKPYSHHVLIQLPASDRAGEAPGAAWPKLVEREPAILSVFMALAKHRQIVEGSVKVTAFEGLPSMAPPSPGACHVLAFPSRAEYINVPLALAGQSALRAVAENRPQLPKLDPAVARAKSAAMTHKVYLFVCCHGARDARCGERGPALLAALRDAFRRRGAGAHVAVAATSHIGGHEFAGNVVCYGPAHPCDGDWFGGLDAARADAFAEAFLAMEVGCDGGAEHAVLRRWWRGRMGLSQAEQEALFDAGGAVEDAEIDGDPDEDVEEEEMEDEADDGIGGEFGPLK